jgi:isopenicillin N synthase-like dioxygenase
MEPYKPEIQAFIDFTHKEIMFKLLRLFAIALEIQDEDYFVKLHDYNKHDETWLRYMEYYDAYNEDEKKETGNLWLGGHQDFTMSTLQICDYDDDSKWKYVKHIPGALIVNLGETFLWWTGNYFKAAIHRVVEPPKDQRGHDRSCRMRRPI